MCSCHRQLHDTFWCNIFLVTWWLVLCTLPVFAQETIAEVPVEKTDDVIELATLDYSHAWHPAFQWQSETAWQVPKGEFYIGSWRLGYAPLNKLSIRTTMFPWILKGANATFRVPIYQDANWLIGTEFGFLRLDFLALMAEGEEADAIDEAADAVLYINPLYLNLTRRLGDRFLVGASLRHNQVTFSGGVDSGEEVEVSGAAATTNTHLRWQFAVAISDRWSFWFIRNRLLKQDVSAENYNVISLNNGGQIEVFLDGSSDLANYENATANGLRLYYHGKRTEMMGGFDIGQAPIYMVGFVSPEKIFLPYFSLGWSF